jgi:hypothetical protein
LGFKAAASLMMLQLSSLSCIHSVRHTHYYYCHDYGRASALARLLLSLQNRRGCNLIKSDCNVCIKENADYATARAGFFSAALCKWHQGTED